MQLKFGITFCHPKEREAWMTNSIGNCLKKLAGKEGLVEACHDRSNTGEVGRWKWVGDGVPRQPLTRYPRPRANASAATATYGAKPSSATALFRSSSRAAANRR